MKLLLYQPDHSNFTPSVTRLRALQSQVKCYVGLRALHTIDCLQFKGTLLLTFMLILQDLPLLVELYFKFSHTEVELLLSDQKVKFLNTAT